METDDPKILGMVERVVFKTQEGTTKEVLAKVDTGADNTSIDETLAMELELGPIVDTHKVKSSHGTSVRPVVECTFLLKNVPIKIEANLTDRSHLKYPMLIGKDVITKYRFVVNPEKQPQEFMHHEPPLSNYTAAVISLGSKSSLMTIHEMTKYFKRVDNLNVRNIEIQLNPKEPMVLYEGKPLEKYDCVYVKGSFRYADVLATISRFLLNKCYLPLHPSSFAIVHDKLSTHLVLQENKIPMPATYFASSNEAARKLLKRIKYPIILKFPKGTQGKGVMFADSYTSANTILDALDTLRQPFIVQEFIDTHGEDIRAIVLGDRVVAAMKRKAAVGDVRSNIHMGGLGEKVELDEKTKNICVRAARVLKAEICAIDMLEGPTGPLVIEANISPGLQGITKATRINIAGEIARFLYNKTREFKEKHKSTGTTRLFEELGLSTSQPNGYSSLITTLKLKGNSIVLPEIILKKSKLMDGEEVDIKFKEGTIMLKRFLHKKEE